MRTRSVPVSRAPTRDNRARGIMTEVVDARASTARCIGRDDFVEEFPHHAVHGSRGQSVSRLGHEECRSRDRRHDGVAVHEVALECASRGRMQRNEPRLTEFGLSDREHARIQVSVRVPEAKCLRDSKASRGEEADEGDVRFGAESARRGEVLRGADESLDLLWREDVRRRAPVSRAQ